MARIRTIKPTFWTDSKVVRASRDARLLFIGMWNFASCDNGHVIDDSYQLKLQILPADGDVDVDSLIDELIDKGLVSRLALEDGRTFLHVIGLSEHQKTDTRWTPRCSVCLAGTHRNSPELAETPLNSPQESKGKESKKTCASIKPDAEFETWWKLYPLKKAKGQAEKAFRAAIKHTDHETLLAAVAAYAKSVEGKDPQFIAYGSTWLNGKRWLDEDLRPVSAEAINDWLRTCWDAHDTTSIENRSGLTFRPPDIPADIDDVRAFTLAARRDWITDNRDDIIRRIMAREANAA
ncbi:hypothetical protein [Rhodococcus jostii]|uniref:hypothetical protein n=1 Tax=Rhodococcus jostii TaxID=132919 RepID=UPI00363A1CB7